MKPSMTSLHTLGEEGRVRIKKISQPILLGMAVVACFLFPACGGHQDGDQGGDGYKTTVSFNPGDESKITEAFLALKDSSCLILKAGVYKFDNLSIAQLRHILIKGEGPDRTILDFSMQTQGGEGIRVTDVKGFTIKDMTIRDSKGDLLKVNKSEDVVITNLHAIWKTSDSSSGGYA